MDKLISEESALKLKETLLEQERELLRTRNEYLTQELEAKAEKEIELRKERATAVGELESQLAAKNEEVRCIMSSGLPVNSL